MIRGDKDGTAVILGRDTYISLDLLSDTATHLKIEYLIE